MLETSGIGYVRLIWVVRADSCFIITNVAVAFVLPPSGQEAGNSRARAGHKK